MRFTAQLSDPFDIGCQTLMIVAEYDPGEPPSSDSPGEPPSVEVIECHVSGGEHDGMYWWVDEATFEELQPSLLAQGEREYRDAVESRWHDY